MNIPAHGLRSQQAQPHKSGRDRKIWVARMRRLQHIPKMDEHTELLLTFSLSSILLLGGQGRSS